MSLSEEFPELLILTPNHWKMRLFDRKVGITTKPHMTLQLPLGEMFDVKFGANDAAIERIITIPIQRRRCMHPLARHTRN
jgi:hypothetical protein